MARITDKPSFAFRAAFELVVAVGLIAPEIAVVWLVVAQPARTNPSAPRAPVAIVAFSDFECPFCARFAVDAFPKLRPQYVDTGRGASGVQTFAAAYS
jgi:protein-disulfide isomerase